MPQVVREALRMTSQAMRRSAPATVGKLTLQTFKRYRDINADSFDAPVVMEPESTRFNVIYETGHEEDMHTYTVQLGPNIVLTVNGCDEVTKVEINNAVRGVCSIG